MSVAHPDREKESISKIKLDPQNWGVITGQVGPKPAGNPNADNYAPGQYTGGTQPQAVGEPTSNYAPGQPTAPTSAAWRTVSGAKINP